MKYVVFLKFAVSVFIVLLTVQSSYGQRVIDIEPRLVYPDSGHLFLSPRQDSMIYYIINHGPDTIYPTDVYFNSWVIAEVYPEPQQISPFGIIVPPGDSILITNKFSLDYNNYRPSIKFCIELKIWSKTSSTILREVDSPALFTNNRKCTVVAHKRIASNKNEMPSSENFMVYPNPSSNTIQLQGIPQNAAYNITNLLGESVSQGIYNQEIDILNLPNGVYIVQVQAEGTRYYAKFIKH